LELVHARRVVGGAHYRAYRHTLFLRLAGN
jgi:hypothetical protein